MSFQPLLLLSSTSAMSAQVQPLSSEWYGWLVLKDRHWLVFFIIIESSLSWASKPQQGAIIITSTKLHNVSSSGQLLINSITIAIVIVPAGTYHHINHHKYHNYQNCHQNCDQDYRMLLAADLLRSIQTTRFLWNGEMLGWPNCPRVSWTLSWWGRWWGCCCWWWWWRCCFCLPDSAARASRRCRCPPNSAAAY